MSGRWRALAGRGRTQARAGDFFAAHESWEELWLELRGDDRLWMQALIQSVVALHHAMAGNMPGAVSQREKARVKSARLAAEGFQTPEWAHGLGLPGPVRLLDLLLAWEASSEGPPREDWWKGEADGQGQDHA